ncbi:hypothetical protein P3T76_006093 [Phytophthora citrophthora]|uniref:RxLR effector protein n=1 Tax=Phytophthora citrophthora TaxID=4793 RepID=A0AAD9LPZ2_9STRA|nr:hypothetical protein P3T76_006093 [Phytophthora citrophthora]
MRVLIAVLVAAFAFFVSNGVAAAAALVSNPAKLEETETHFVQNEANRGRLLRKRLEAESEERAGLLDIATKAKQYMNGEQKLAKLFKKTDEQLFKKKISSAYLSKGITRLENAGWPAAKIEKFKAVANRYSNFRTTENLQNYRLNFDPV